VQSAPCSNLYKDFQICSQWERSLSTTLITTRYATCVFDGGGKYEFSAASAVLSYVRTTKMRPIVTDRVPWSVGRRSVCLSVCDTTVSHAKTAQPIEMPVGLRTRMEVQISPREGAILRGKGAARCKALIATLCRELRRNG